MRMRFNQYLWMEVEQPMEFLYFSLNAFLPTIFNVEEARLSIPILQYLHSTN